MMINWYSSVTLNDFTFQRITQKTLHRPMLQQHISRIPHLTKDINNKFSDKLIPIINQSFRNNFPLLLKQSLNRSTNQREIEKLRDRRSITYFVVGSITSNTECFLFGGAENQAFHKILYLRRS